MGAAKREFLVLVAIGAAYVFAFAVTPHSNVARWEMHCPNKEITSFENMAACTGAQEVDCPCLRPENPWFTVFWIGVPLVLGVGAGLLLRSRSLVAASLLAGTLILAGIAVLMYMSGADLVDAEGLGYGLIALVTLVAKTLLAYAVTRYFVHRLLKSREAP
jgi:hypothetical protein